jgi:hypothetical protein
VAVIGSQKVVYDVVFLVARSHGRGERTFVNVWREGGRGGWMGVPGITRLDYGTVPAAQRCRHQLFACDCRSVSTFIDIGQGHEEKGGRIFPRPCSPFPPTSDAVLLKTHVDSHICLFSSPSSPM